MVEAASAVNPVLRHAQIERPLRRHRHDEPDIQRTAGGSQIGREPANRHDFRRRRHNQRRAAFRQRRAFAHDRRPDVREALQLVDSGLGRRRSLVRSSRLQRAFEEVESQKLLSGGLLLRLHISERLNAPCRPCPVDRGARARRGPQRQRVSVPRRRCRDAVAPLALLDRPRSFEAPDSAGPSCRSQPGRTWSLGRPLLPTRRRHRLPLAVPAHPSAPAVRPSPSAPGL